MYLRKEEIRWWFWASVALLLVLMATRFAFVRGAEPDAETRIRVALALAAASQPVAKVEADPLTSYFAARAQSLADGLPLVVLVGLPLREIPGPVRTVHVAEFPGVGAGPCAIVAVPANGVMGNGTRLDDVPSDAAILIAAHKADKVRLEALPGWSNVGACSCGVGRCQCIPASRCPGGCPKPAAKPLSAAPAKVGVCPT